jgi:uncharacterized protein YdeI (YjbR/CyaY-like superfamily)
LETLDVVDRRGWHDWLEKHHLESVGVMLVFHKGGAPTITYDESLDEALAYGWIDSVIRKIDDRRYVRKFTPRRPGSIWSTPNINRVERLEREGRMTQWGAAAFERRTPEISDLEKVTAEGAKVPSDFEIALRKHRKAWENFQKMAPSHRKRYLIWLAGAKKPETRKKRIGEAVKLVEKNVKNLMK